jgi:predicted ATPase/DNA-binding winged helix-turn-helix (wHTH) protein
MGTGSAYQPDPIRSCSYDCQRLDDLMLNINALQGNEIVSFGPFHLSASARLLVKDDVPVAVGGRGLDVLIALIERAGEVVSRRDLLTRVWPDVIVGEANLRGQVASLRKALCDGQEGARYIVNVPSQGYSFIAPVQRSTAEGQPRQAAAPARSAGPAQLPARLPRMIGRDETVAALSALLRSHRFVSIVGAGGMGKTTVAVSVGHALLDDFPDAVFFVDLGALTEAALVPTVITAALGLPVQAQDPLLELLAFLVETRIVIILDSCEHVIEAVATFTERLFSEAPTVHILTTTREALRVEGEHVYLLMPLDDPPECPELTAASAQTFPAVQLFMERAAASGYRSELSDADVPVVARICRRLDGIALAIELAASRVGIYGIQGTAELLNSRFRLMWQGRRTALPRHQTMQATLDWSYDLISEAEQLVLRRLSIFVGNFTLGGALSIAGEADADAVATAGAVASLVSKSLVWTSSIDGCIYHRLPDSARTYAVAKLAEADEEKDVARRHALYYSRTLKSDAIENAAFGGGDLGPYAPHISNVRAALEWSFSDTGDTAVGVELAACAAPLFLGLSLLSECERWCERGLAALNGADQGKKRELTLRKALAISCMFTRGNSDEVRVGIESGLGLAEASGDKKEQLHLLAGLNIFLCRVGDYRAALGVAERSALIAADSVSQTGVVMAEWMLGVAHHLVGNQKEAQCYCELGLKHASESGGARVYYFGYDHRVRALAAFARVLWLRGLPDKALKWARQAIDEAAALDRPVTLCISLIYAVPVFLWSGDFDGAEQRIDWLNSYAAKHSLAPFQAVGFALKGELMVARGENRAGIELLRSALLALQTERFHLLTSGFYRSLAEGLAHAGRSDEASDVIAGAVKRAQEQGGTFDKADLLRTQGEILMTLGQRNFTAAQDSLLCSLDWARRHSALGWELRSAIALAHLWVECGRGEQARTILAEVYQQFTEGFATADPKTARTLLEKSDGTQEAG